MADFVCRDCGAEWSGHNTAHCAAKGCHQTFTGITAFDKHRRNYKCLNPETAGLVSSGRAYPCWGVERSEQEEQ